jgi:intracellular sulfur oxidation DsrE/DsrF family protein
MSSAVPFHAAMAAPSAPSLAHTPWSEAWLDRITGKHKQFFDAEMPNEGFPLVFAMAFLNLYHEAYGLTDKDLSAVVGLRHFAMPIGVSDAIWAKYKIGEALKIDDAATKAPAVRNPFLHPDGMPFPGSELPTLVNRGVIFTVCNVALTVISGKLAGNAGVTADAAKQEWTAAVVPGATIVPVGVLAVNRAQEKGCTYCYGGG